MEDMRGAGEWEMDEWADHFHRTMPLSNWLATHSDPTPEPRRGDA